ncbi:MAG TPA: prepilin-type N-terminal cleavage/methylation domain-containing protein [Alphaproteobacteria bacterium]|nr:prepilin-type N-terminal cleavage/methylation domain-containing protein [Alphaproteobacteria bacterium]
MSRRCQAEGFTLVEVLVALVILGLVLGACYRLLSTGLKSTAEADGLFRAVMVAESALADASQRTDPRDAASDLAIDGYRCNVAVVPYDDAALPGPEETGLRLYRVTVSVEWGLHHSYELATLALGPAS